MNNVYEFSGWLLDLYEDQQSGIIIWFIKENSQRIRLRQKFAIRFYAEGSKKEIENLSVFLQSQPLSIKTVRTERKDLYRQKMIPVLEIELQPNRIQALVQQISKKFPTIDLYDADIPLTIRHASKYDTFPLAYCHVVCTGENIQDISVLDSPWDIDPISVPLRVMHIDVDCNPKYETPKTLLIHFDNERHCIPVRHTSSIIRLNSLLMRYDPDLVVTNSGDTWLLPYLFKIANDTNIAFKINRDQNRNALIKKEGSYFSYGKIVYRGQQVLLYGRCHIDNHNAMLWQNYELTSVLEMARVTRLPLQVAARCSPGTGINMMEVLTALRHDVLVPWRKTQGEKMKTAYDLLHSDQGGLAYQPIEGVHENVGFIDYISLYPSLMVHCNISPELPAPKYLGKSPYPPGLIPLTLKPLLEKRILLKQRFLSLPLDDPARPIYEDRAASLKMLLVCCFGYLGYKNAKFGRIESHETISLLGREALLIAKEVAEDMGYTVLHLYIDGIWVKKNGCDQPSDFSSLLNSIVDKTSLPISLDCIYRWIVFVPSKQNSNMTVPNRYFGLKQDGDITIRGIGIRRHDTAPYILKIQEDILQILQKAFTSQEIQQRLPEILNLIRERYKTLIQEKVDLEDLVIHKRMGKELEGYRVLSPVVIAVRQFQKIGQPIRLGQSIPFIFTQGKPGVCAWHELIPIDNRTVNYCYYGELLIRATLEILQPFGICEKELKEHVINNGDRQIPFDFRN